MSTATVAVLSPGDMGHSVGQRLREGGLRVITCLEGRSQRTRDLTRQAGIEEVATYRALLQQADIILSIVVPAEAENVATAVAAAAVEAGALPLFVDCNAIAPGTAQRIAKALASAGMPMADACIIGGPPRDGSHNRFYVSGPHASRAMVLNEHGLVVRDLGGAIGQASALKMCYAALTKGTTALCTQLLTAAAALDVLDPLLGEFGASQSAMLARMKRSVPAMPVKAHRWVGEMLEIAATFDAVGLGPDTFRGAAEIYRLVAGTSLAESTPEGKAPLPSLEETIAELLAVL